MTVQVQVLVVLIFTVGFLSTATCQSGRFRSQKTPIAPPKSINDFASFLKSFRDNPIELAEYTTPQLIQYYGYPAESHKVVTADGYILTMHRIPFGKNRDCRTGRTKKAKPVVLLQHGLFGSSYEWVINVKHSILAFKLADAGYDVWLGNARGNKYSRQHVNMTVKESMFWEFSFHEMGKYDMPAEIDYVLFKTGKKKLKYIGFSMGTTLFFVMMSIHPSYNQKVELMIGFAPVAYVDRVQGAPGLLVLLELIPQLKKMLQEFTIGEFFPPLITKLINKVGIRFCSSNIAFAESWCRQIYLVIMGWQKTREYQVVTSQLPQLFGNFPSPTSLRTGSHYLQFMNDGEFREYDFGFRENQIRYHQSTPPSYSLNKTIVPVAFLWGHNDGLVNPISTARVVTQLPKVIFNRPVDFPYWNHFDFHIGKDADKLVHKQVLKLLSKY